MSQRQFEEFEVGEVIGVGTAGTIYDARDRASSDEVALKVLLPSVSRVPIVAARFKREMLILEKLTHPNIVRYYGGGQHGEQLFYAMELLTRGSLKAELERGGKLSVLEAVTCGVQICSALQYAHNHGIIHRDLKPSNLLFKEDGELKLVDFGIARDTHEADITSEGLTVGSYMYMAPEQIQAETEISGQVDLYSFGCVLYEMLCGRPPFVGENFAQIFEQHLRARPKSLCEQDPRIPRELEDLVFALLEKAPEDRPFNARNVQISLLKLIDQQVSQTDTGSDVSAQDVVDRGKVALAQRLEGQDRNISWLALAGMFLAGVLLVSVAWLLSAINES